MKSFLLIFVFLSFYTSHSQKSFPYNTKLLDHQNKEFNSNLIVSDGSPVIIDFWASYCKPCIIKYNTFKDIYEEWQKKTGVKIIIISVDKEEHIQRAENLIRKYNWPFEVYFDPKSELLEKMDGKGAVPRSFIYDKNFNLIYKKRGAKIMSKEDLKDASRVIRELYKEKKPLNNFICDVRIYMEVVDSIIK